MCQHALPPLRQKSSEFIRGPQYFQGLQLHVGIHIEPFFIVTDSVNGRKCPIDSIHSSKMVQKWFGFRQVF